VRGGWGRLFSSTLGVAKKTVNGVTVGYVVGFVEGDRFTRSLRRNMIFKSKEAAIKFLHRAEKKTVNTPRPEFAVIEKGKTR